MKRLLLVAALLAAAAFAATWPSDIWPAPVPAPGSEAEVARHASAMQPPLRVDGPLVHGASRTSLLDRLLGAWGRQVAFAAYAGDGPARDIFTARVTMDGSGRVTGLSDVVNRTSTADGDEAGLVSGGAFVAYATLVGKDYQLVTVARPDLAAEGRLVLILSRPDSDVRLNWESPGVLAVGLSAGRAMRLDATTRVVSPADAPVRLLVAGQGELAWLPRLVNTVREHPWVGPEKIAFLENVYFYLVDIWDRATYRGPGQAAAPSPTPAAPGTASTPAPASAVTPVVPSPAAGGTAGRHCHARGDSPATRADPATIRQALGSNAGRPGHAALLGVPRRQPAVREGGGHHDRPRAVRSPPGGRDGGAALDHRPGGHGRHPRRRGHAAGLVAAFNGGWAAMHGHYGMMIDRQVYLPARNGVATLAWYADGSLRLGVWGRDIQPSPDIVSYRQNCLPLIENGVISPELGKLSLWGLSISRRGRDLPVGTGPDPRRQADLRGGQRALGADRWRGCCSDAGAYNAMLLDIDDFHVAFITYRQVAGKDGKSQVGGDEAPAGYAGFRRAVPAAVRP